MDATQVIILTSIVNIIISGLVGGIVVYVIQKKIDATIQKSLFEHQIKFSTVYPKTLEILEAYNQKLLDCSHRSGTTLWRITELLSRQKTLKDHSIQKELDELEAMGQEMSSYFRNNHIHFPSMIIEELDEINDRASSLLLILHATAMAVDTPTEAQMEYLKMSATMLGVSPDQEPTEQQVMLSIAIAVRQEFLKVSNRFEKLYKSVTESKDRS